MIKDYTFVTGKNARVSVDGCGDNAVVVTTYGYFSAVCLRELADELIKLADILDAPPNEYLNEITLNGTEYILTKKEK